MLIIPKNCNLISTLIVKYFIHEVFIIKIWLYAYCIVKLVYLYSVKVCCLIEITFFHFNYFSNLIKLNPLVNFLSL